MCILTVFTRESTAGSVRKTTLHRAPVGGIEKLIVHGLCVLYYNNNSGVLFKERKLGGERRGVE